MKNTKIPTLLLLTLPTFLVAILVLVSMKWPISTRIQLEVTSSRVSFTLGGIENTQLLNSLLFESITLEKFEQIQFSPEKLEVADSRPEDQNGENWSIIQVTPPVTVRGEDDRFQPAVTLEAAEPGKTVTGTLDQIWVSPGSEVTMEIRGDQKAVMTILVERQASSSVMSLHEPFWAIMDYCQIADRSNLSYQTDTLTFKAQLPAHNHQIKTTSDNQTMVFILTLNKENISDLFPKSGLIVTELNFTDQNKKGAPQTALVNEGELSYPGYSEIAKVPIRTSDYINLERVDMLIKEMDLVFDPKPMGIRMLLDGVVGSIKTGSNRFSKDQSLTLFDIFWHNPKMTILFSIICWVFPTTLGGYRLIKEFKN